MCLNLDCLHRGRRLGLGSNGIGVFVRLAWKNDGRGNLFFQYFNILLVKKKKKNYYVARV
jgi:hypothetical protein